MTKDNEPCAHESEGAMRYTMARQAPAEYEPSERETELEAARLFGGGFFGCEVKEETREWYRRESRMSLIAAHKARNADLT